nr:IncF plasmid conjugative transfer DNA-nicking and unwinding protein TraI; truncated [Klebsiella pneumoniae]
MGNEDARFVALQNSRNGESLLAGNMGEGVRMARDNPDTGWWCGWPVMTAPGTPGP